MKILLSICLLMLSYGKLRAQLEQAYVTDTILDKKLRAFLVSRGEVMGDTAPCIRGTLLITLQNLKTDSTVTDQRQIGIYSFRASLQPWLYIQHKDSIEILNLEDTTDFRQPFLKAISFLEAHSSEYNETEKLRIMQEFSKVVYQHRNQKR